MHEDFLAGLDRESANCYAVAIHLGRRPRKAMMMRKKSRKIMLVLLTAGSLALTVPGCMRRPSAAEDIGGGGTFYHSEGHNWGGGIAMNGGYISHGSVSYGGFGGHGGGGSGS